MVNDVRGLFQKINQVDLPYQVFDDVEDDGDVPESHFTVLAPLPAPMVVDEPEEIFVAEVEVAGPGRVHGARAAIAAVRQRVFQGFAQPVAEAAAPEDAPVSKPELKIKSSPVSIAEVRPTVVVAPKPPTVATHPASRGLLRKYAPETEAPVITADGQTHLKTLFAKLSDKG
ncbi:hypothetical protein [Caulobacter sp. NIBR2454]|uniref:hypothetical protein n=1 Tax=Caulobacter sp. NIBR2454 TaxID=3015996 RepID=UPI0022B70615|nr:hypothetical protein [Caulobacter sp. NIBR2454]